MFNAIRRFYEHLPVGRPWVKAHDHPAVLEGRTVYPKTVRSRHPLWALKSGEHSRKLGSRVTKGKWKGMPIFALTLEERATCPRSCSHWLDCYGNKMHWSHRYPAGAQLEERLAYELRELQVKNPRGFVVRLHVLGDFYSVHYVELWGRFMNRFRGLHVFGYTARNPYEDDIGLALLCLRHVFPARWWVRFSERSKETWFSTGPGGIVCPAQTGASACCGTCGLCWTAKKPITFLLH